MKKIIIGAALVLALLVFFIHAPTAAATVLWDLTGTYTIDYTCISGCSGVYPHTMAVTSMNLDDGTFSGTGYYNPNPAYTWNVTGIVSGSDITFQIVYTGLNPGYTVNAIGNIAPGGTLSGSATGPGQTFTWASTSGAATFQRHAEITLPGEDEIVFGSVNFEAYLVDDDYDYVDWAVRRGTCAAGTNTVFGNVDGFSDPYTWVLDGVYTYNFSAIADTSAWTPGMHCFIFNPREDSGESNIRLTRQFYVAGGYVSGGGQIIEEKGNKPKDNYKVSFGGKVWDVGSAGYMGEWEINFHNVSEVYDEYDKSKFHSTDIQVINFYSGSGTCHEAMNMTMLGTLNGESGYKVIFRAGDYGAPGNFDDEAFDTVRVELFEGATKVYDTHGKFLDESTCVGTARTGLDNGNVSIVF